MKILKKLKDEISLLVTNIDDLWYLSQILDSNDLVKGKTQRKIKIGADTDRSKRIVKKSIFLEIKVEKIEFSKSSHNLRVSGTITQGPDDIALGSYHTFNIEENTSFTIKKQWLKYQLDKLTEASSDKVGNIMIVVFDREEAYFALLKKYGYKLLSEIKGKVQKKSDMEKVTGNFYLDIINQMEEYTKRHKIHQIILASPSFWKEYLMKELNNEDLKKIIIPATCSSVGKQGINEVLKRDELKQALKNERAASEMSLVDELLAEIAKEDKACYGIKATTLASDAGAIKTLLITDSFIFDRREKEKYEETEQVLKTVESNRGSVHIISADHDGGKKLNGLGGIAAILRYKLNL